MGFIIGGWKLWNTRMERLRNVPNWLKLTTLEVLTRVHSTIGISYEFDQDFLDWKWMEAYSPIQSKILSSKKAYKLLSVQ